MRPKLRDGARTFSTQTEMEKSTHTSGPTIQLIRQKISGSVAGAMESGTIPWTALFGKEPHQYLVSFSVLNRARTLHTPAKRRFTIHRRVHLRLRASMSIAAPV